MSLGSDENGLSIYSSILLGVTAVIPYVKLLLCLSPLHKNPYMSTIDTKNISLI
jgi:hypothetical protein